MSSNNYQVYLDFDLDEDDSYKEYEAILEVSATPVPYTRATRDCPEEGGYFADVELVKILEITEIEPGDNQNEVEITEKLKNLVEKEFDRQYHEVQSQLGEEEYARNEQ